MSVLRRPSLCLKPSQQQHALRFLFQHQTFPPVSATVTLFEKKPHQNERLGAKTKKKPRSPSLSGGICGISEMSLAVKIRLPDRCGVVAVAGVTLLWCDQCEIESRRREGSWAVKGVKASQPNNFTWMWHKNQGEGRKCCLVVTYLPRQSFSDVAKDSVI